MLYVPLIYLGVTSRRMNGRDMVLPSRDRVEEYVTEWVSLLLGSCKRASKSLLPPSGGQILLYVCVCENQTQTL